MLKPLSIAFMAFSLAATATLVSSAAPKDLGPMPDLSGATGWINSPPLNRTALKGKVVLVDFWTYTCINCLRTLPYIKAWDAKYRDAGLVVIGVHTPEFDFEGDTANVRKAIRKYGISYPIALDSNRKIWDAFHNEYWPAHYFIDAKGRIRYQHFGEGSYEESESMIRQLLAEAGMKAGQKHVEMQAQGEQAPAKFDSVLSPETYIGYERAENFAASPRAAHDRAETYAVPQKLSLNQWGLSGNWRVAGQGATLQQAPGKIVFRFHARDLHLVLGTADGKPVRFKVRLNGAAPGTGHGMDIDADGNGTVQEHRLYQLIRQNGPIEDRTFEIEFLDPRAQAFAFTFG